MPRSGRKSCPYVRKTRQDVREFSGGSSVCPVVIERPPVCPVVLGRPSRMSKSGREDIMDVREWSGGHQGCPGVVESPSRMSRNGR